MDQSLSFNLLLPDRAVKLTFHCPLEPAAYEHLLNVVRSVKDSAELERALRRRPALWGDGEFTIDPA